MKKKITAYNVITNLILQAIILLYGFIIPKIIISNYGSSVNGLVSSITQFLAYISLLDSGFTAVVKSQLYKPIANKDNKTIVLILKSADSFFKKIAVIFVLYIAVLAIVYPLLVIDKFDLIFTFSLVLILSISTFAEYYFGMVYKLYLQSDQKSYVISIIQIITYIFNISITLLLTKINVSIQMLKLFTSVVFILRPLLQLYYVKKHYKIKLKDVSEKYEIKNKWDGLAQHIAYVIHNNTDITVLTIFCDLVEVSVYSVYYLVIKGVKSIIQSFTYGIDAIFGNLIAKEEKKELNTSFHKYEILYNSISVVCFSCAFILITPFVTVYTKNINDAHYIRPLFGYLIVFGEFIWAIRQPYNELIKAAGHFKETRIGAWVECISNIIISLILVLKFGLIGVAIGTIVGILIRTIELLIHANKKILDRKLFFSLKNIIIILGETTLIYIISLKIVSFEMNNYISLVINAVIIFIISVIIVITTNCMFYRKEFKEVLSFFIRKRRKNKNENI